MQSRDEHFMGMAMNEAKKAEHIDEVPVGAIIVRDGKCLARGHNLREKSQNVLDHAEIRAIRSACRKLNSWRLDDCTMYITLEPCPMCAGAIIQSKIKRVVFGAFDPKGGSAGSCINLFEVSGFNHYPKIVGGIMESECSSLLKDYFKKKRIKIPKVD